MRNYFKASSENISIAIKNLADSNIIAHSTDTLPGLAADATNSNAINKIIKLKKRSGPYSIIINSLGDIKKYAIINQKKMDEIKKLLPGKFTILLKNSHNHNLSKLALGNSELIGFRIPEHDFTNELVHKFKKPIITTSLNVTKQESITNLKTASIDFKDLVIFDDEINRDSKGSTILDFSSDTIKIIRYGDEIYKE